MHRNRPQRAYPEAGGHGSGAGTGLRVSPRSSTWSPASTTSTPGPMRAVTAGEWVPVAGTPAEANLLSPDSGARGWARLITARHQPRAQWGPDAATAHRLVGAQPRPAPSAAWPWLRLLCLPRTPPPLSLGLRLKPPSQGPRLHILPSAGTAHTSHLRCRSPALPPAPGAGCCLPKAQQLKCISGWGSSHQLAVR